MTIKELAEFTMNEFVLTMKNTKKDDFKKELDLKILRDVGKSISIQVQALLDYQESTLNMVELYSNFTDDIEDDIKNKEGFVYIAKQLNEPDIFKIGITNNITKRGNTFKTGNAFVEMVASLKSPRYKEIEKIIHKREVENRFSREWFKLDSITLNNIINDYGFNIHLGNKNV